MEDSFDIGGYKLNLWPQKDAKNHTELFGKPYQWVKEDGRLRLHALPASPVTLGKWGCCGRLRVL